MFKSLRSLMVAFVFGIAALAVPAAAQTTPSTTTSPTTTTCSVGCPQTLTITGLSGFGGVVQGGFGTVDANGNLVAGNGISGTVGAVKDGGGSVDVNIDFEGCLTLNCGNTTTSAQVNAWEAGQVNVTGTTSAPGTMLTLANSGSLGAVAGIALQYSPGSMTTTGHTADGQ